MRVDGLTTAKMLAITTALSFNRLLRNEGVRQDNEQSKIGEFKKKIKGGISRAVFIDGLLELGFPEAEYFMDKGNTLEFYNEEHEHIFNDNAKEDDGTSGDAQRPKEVGFIGLRQIEAEKNAAE